MQKVYCNLRFSCFWCDCPSSDPVFYVKKTDLILPFCPPFLSADNLNALFWRWNFIKDIFITVTGCYRLLSANSKDLSWLFNKLLTLGSFNRPTPHDLSCIPATVMDFLIDCDTKQGRNHLRHQENEKWQGSRSWRNLCSSLEGKHRNNRHRRVPTIVLCYLRQRGSSRGLDGRLHHQATQKKRLEQPWQRPRQHSPVNPREDLQQEPAGENERQSRWEADGPTSRLQTRPFLHGSACHTPDHCRTNLGMERLCVNFMPSTACTERASGSSYDPTVYRWRSST